MSRSDRILVAAAGSPNLITADMGTPRLLGETLVTGFASVMGLPVVRMLLLIERHGWRYGFGRLEAAEG